jgi:peptidyl-tRNA hydrolase, PTH1 family
MNRSGTARKSSAIAKTATIRLHWTKFIICYDDLNLEQGVPFVFRAKGSAGGHNGLASILSQLQTRDIPRLRIGIGNDFQRGGQSDYVLSEFTEEQRKLVDESIEVASEAILTFLRGGIDAAMNKFN